MHISIITFIFILLNVTVTAVLEKIESLKTFINLSFSIDRDTQILL